MYDTINLWLPAVRAGKTDLLANACYLKHPTKHTKEDGQVNISGWLSSYYKANISDHGVSFTGSIPKYANGNNYHTLTLGETKRAFEKMADEIHLPIDRSLVRRIDFAQNFIMNYAPETYYDHLGDCKRYRRVSEPHSLYYRIAQRTKLFYNKIAEGNKKGIPIPQTWQGKNVLRYELRYVSRLPSQFNMSEITASILWDENFYHKEMFKRWMEEYENINKLRIYTPQIDKPMTATQSKEILFASLVSQTGQIEVMQMVEQWHKQKLFSTNREYYRAKGQLKAIMKKLPDGRNELIAELDKKVREVQSVVV